MRETLPRRTLCALLACLLPLLCCAPALAAFDPGREITLFSREDGSGTRSAFVELLGILLPDEDGAMVDRTSLEAIVTNATSVVLIGVAGDPYAIGYVSMGSLGDTVRALGLDGVPATAAAVKSGAYPLSRPFNIVTGAEVGAAARDFIDFILSADGQRVVEAAGYIAVADGAPDYAGGSDGKVVVSGSSSVTPAMEKLKEAYLARNPQAQVEIQQSDSTTGIRATLDGIADIGMASRAVRQSELDAGLVPTVIAMDGIAIVVNLQNPHQELPVDTVRRIFMGEILTWNSAEME